MMMMMALVKGGRETSERRYGRGIEPRRRKGQRFGVIGFEKIDRCEGGRGGGGIGIRRQRVDQFAAFAASVR